MKIEMSATNSHVINVNVLNSLTKQIFKMNQKIIQQYIKSEKSSNKTKIEKKYDLKLPEQKCIIFLEPSLSLQTTRKQIKC